jgi:proline iminopeptidase
MNHTPRAHAWQSMYPPLQSHAQGWLAVGDGHEVFWEQCGNPLGEPALFVHGGPGAGCNADDRRWFDPRHYRIVLFDQRGAGRSRPAGRLVANTTEHLLRDIEALREQLGVERWLLFGGSWGATLALAYAQAHPRRVSGLVLRGVFTATAAECRSLYGARQAAFLAQLAQRLHSGDAATEQIAAQVWRRREQALMAHELPPGAVAAPDVPRDRTSDLAVARVGVHFARRAFHLREAQLLEDATRLRGVPGVIVQGSRDRVTPPIAALALHHAWPDSRLQLIADGGHASRHPQMAQALVAATDSFVGPAVATCQPEIVA